MARPPIALTPSYPAIRRVAGTTVGDGEEIDAYILGPDKPVAKATGSVGSGEVTAR